MRYLILVLLAITACTLTTTAPATLQPTPFDLSDLPLDVATEEADSIQTEEPQTGDTSNTVPVSDNGSQSQTGQNNPVCVPRTDWVYTYVVVAGDTLSNIAQRASSTAAALASGNCLPNANVISVGQVLRVPRPVTATLPPTATSPVVQPGQRGTIFVSSFISADAGSYLLLRGETITLRWDNPPANLYRASFVIQNPITGAQTQIAEDSNPTNGVAVSWTVPAGVQGSLIAIGRFLNSNAVASSYPAGVSSAPPKGQGCELTAASGTTLSAYMQPDVNSGVFLTAAAGEYFESLGRSLNGWFAIDPPAIPDIPYGVNRLRWIPPGNNLRGRGNCPADVLPDTGGNNPGVQTYTNVEVGFALDYPAGWNQIAEANYVDFVAPDGRTFEVMFGVPGSTVPLEQAVADCKNSPLCIGDRKILLEQPVALPDGLSGIRLELSASLSKPDTTPTVYVFSIISNRNLVFRGFGSTNPAYFNSILNSLRLLRF
ncbi:MAG TPA: LysM peptidoglycan-binding domain-containing protein [Spirillospora sp.]|nr:LysM peptidoglycan-binding domain-containing protein [Spirillospora sp.]